MPADRASFNLMVASIQEFLSGAPSYAAGIGRERITMIE
jgi:hypothetical protein